MLFCLYFYVTFLSITPYYSGCLQMSQSCWALRLCCLLFVICFWLQNIHIFLRFWSTLLNLFLVLLLFLFFFPAQADKPLNSQGLDVTHTPCSYLWGLTVFQQAHLFHLKTTNLWLFVLWPQPLSISGSPFGDSLSLETPSHLWFSWFSEEA